MWEEKNHLILDNYELKILVRALNELRNRLILEKRCTDPVDEILIKAVDPKKKRVHIDKRDFER